MIDLEAFRAEVRREQRQKLSGRLGEGVISILLPKGYSNADQAHHHAQGHDQGRQDHARAQEAEKVATAEDRSSQEA